MSYELLVTARGWLKSHRAYVLMPRADEPETHGVSKFYHANSIYDLRPAFLAKFIDDVPGRMIPFLAGLECGLTDQELGVILKHHGVDVSDIRKLRFESRTLTCLKAEDTDKWITPPEIHIRFCSAMLTFTPPSEFSKEFHHGNDLIRFGLLHSEYSSLWTDSVITENQKRVYRGAAFQQDAGYNDFGGIVDCLLSKDDLPNGSFEDFFQRSGMLNEGTITHRLDRTTFWASFIDHLNDRTEIAVEMFDYVCSVTDEQKQKLIIRAIKSLEFGSIGLGAKKTMTTLSERIPENCFLREALASAVLRINLLNSEIYEAAEKVLMWSCDPYRDLLSRKNMLLSMVANEVMAVRPAAMGFNHFSAFSRLDFMNLPPQIIDLKPEHLVNHLFDAFDMFKKPEKCSGIEKDQVDAISLRGIESAVTLIARHHDLDQETLNHRSSSEKALLAKAGVSPKGFTGISNKHKGQIIEDLLGL